MSRHPAVTMIMRLMVWLLYRSVEVSGPVYWSDRGPVLAVSTHFGGLPDPLLIVDVTSRWPRFMGKDVIFKAPVLGWLARYLGGIPVHQPSRSESREGADANRAMFRSAHDALAQRNLVVIFPEGVTPDDPAITKVRTGAARIALGAREDGVAGLRILPVAIHYADRKSLRSRVFVNVGHPLELDRWVSERAGPEDDQGSGNHPMVVALTEDIEHRMRAIAPDFANWREAHLYGLAAEVAIRGEHAMGDPVGYAERETLAGAVNRQASPEQRVEVIALAERYDDELTALRLTDQSLGLRAASFGNFVAYLAISVVMMLVLAPFALFGFAVNAVPLVLVWLVGRLPLSDALMATVKPAAAIVSFGVAWGIALWQALGAGIVYLVGTAVLLPLSMLALVSLSERILATVETLALWRRAKGPHGLFATVMADRRALERAVRDVTGPTGGDAG